jgi:hypothetical protein
MNNITSTIARNTQRIALLLLAVCAFAASIHITELTSRAQDKPPKFTIKERYNPQRVETSVEGRARAYGCSQQLNDLSIVRLSAKKYIFRARTVCPATMSIEFYEQPPISQYPLRFKGTPAITYGTAERRLITEHEQTTDLLPDKTTDYYVVVVTDSSGRELRKAGSLTLDSKPPIRVQTEMQRPGSSSISPIRPLGKQKSS